VKRLVENGNDFGWVLGLAKFGGLAFFALVAKLVNK